MGSFVSMTAKEFREYLAKNGNIAPKNEIPKQKVNKYHAEKAFVGEKRFDSRFEAQRYQELVNLEKAGKITNLQTQVPFELQPGYTNNQGKKIRPITYLADFTYSEGDLLIVEDTKSPATRTEVYKIKKKLFEARFPEYIFREIYKKQN